MTDPFSVAASTAGIISLGLTVSSGLVRFVQTVQGAPKELETVCNDVYALCGVLEQIKELSSTSAKPAAATTGGGSTPSAALKPAAILPALENCNAIFESLKNELDRASKQIEVKTKTTKTGLFGYGGDGGEKIVLSMRERVEYFFRKGELDGVRRDLREAKMTLILAINVAGLDKMVSKAPMAGRGEEHAAERAYLLATVVSLKTELNKLQKRQHGSGAPPSHTPPQGPARPSTPSPQWGHANAFLVTPPPPASVFSGQGGSTADLDKGSASSIDPALPDSDSCDSGREDVVPTAATLRAWTTTATPESASLAALGLRCHIEAAQLPREELLAMLGRPRGNGGGGAMSARLRRFNEPVRQMILRHAASLPGARLVGVEGLEDERGRVVQSVFGDVGVVAPVWVTAHGDADGERDEEVEREVRRRLERMGIGVGAGHDVRTQAVEEEEEERRKKEMFLRMEKESREKAAYTIKAESVQMSPRAELERKVVEKSYKEEANPVREGAVAQMQEAKLRMMEEDLAARRKKQKEDADKLVGLKEEVKLLERKLMEADMRRDMDRALDIRHGALPDVKDRIQEVEAEMMQDGKTLLELEIRVLEERRREREKRKSEEKQSVQETEIYRRGKSPGTSKNRVPESISRDRSARSSGVALQKGSEPFEVTLDRDAAEALARDLIAEWIQG